MKDAPLDIDKVWDTPFCHKLMAAQVLISDGFSKRKGYIEGNNNHHLLSEAEKKTSRIFRLFSSLGTIAADIRMVYRLINRFPPKSFLDKYNISELDYIKFHYEVFIHKIHTICEIMKLMANEVLDLKIPHKECSWAKLVRKKEFNTSNCKKVIQEYFTHFESLIDDRHLNSHRGIFEDLKMDEISPVYFIYRWYKMNNLEIESVFTRGDPKPYFKYKIREYRKEKLKEILEHEQVILQYLHKFVISLESSK